MGNRSPSAAGYAEEADALARQYESLSFEQMNRHLLPLFPLPPARVLDIGAGTGRDAAALARLGHGVVAVEPTAEMRAHGQRLHADAAIEWLDDLLPDLPRLRGRQFDLIMMIAVWMHLDAEERLAAMATVAGLLAPSGLAVLSIRHGPVPAGRRMFEVSAAETRDLAARRGLECVHESETDDAYKRDGVTWTRLAFRNAQPRHV
ncbi:MAG: class I SAM-dependent methyltransferase [Alphaproteobacteria bacterium]|nr:class I SAM-dependent methyltransferase [Alphaproteobacteria bacterium]